MRLTPRVAGFRSEYPAGFKLECMAGFVGTRITELIDDRCEQLHLVRLRSRWNVAIAQAGARSVGADDAKALCETTEETPKYRMLPIPLNVTDPPRGAKDERSLADRGIRDPGAICIPNDFE